MPPDWREKAMENVARTRNTLSKQKVDVVINADETFLLFHPFGQWLIAPTGIKCIRTAVQVDNEKWGVTVMISCEYWMSSILPPMIIFMGVYCVKWMKQNEDDTTNTSIILEFVDEGLTPIIQVPDIAVNKVFKAGVKQRYHQYRSTLPVAIGEKVVVSCEMLVDFVLDTIWEINGDNNEHQFIAESFRRCGLNPWCREKSLEAFHNHLEALKKNTCYK